MTEHRPIIGISMGDPAGIGPEIILSAFSEPVLFDICRPLILGDTWVLTKVAALLGKQIQIHPVNMPEEGHFSPGSIDLLPLSDLTPGQVFPGKPTAITGKAMLAYIEACVDLAMAKKISAMVTCPVTKTAMKMAGSDFHGHTELIAHRSGAREVAMMLAGETLKVVLVTIHIPISLVSKKLSIDGIVRTIRMTSQALVERFGIPNPKIGVAGLNPHAGEAGLFGSEEETLIRPAVLAAQKMGLPAEGPLPPDTVFYHAARGRYDSVVCMYHDQGLIPFKMLHFHDGVNITLGLPIIRTSVDHGTAYDIAWQGIADHTSLVQAVKTAVRHASVKR